MRKRRRRCAARGTSPHAAEPSGKVDLPALMLELGRREINELHVEAGSKLNASLVREGCVDELLVYLAPSLIGPGQGMFALPPLAHLAGQARCASTACSRSAPTCASWRVAARNRHAKGTKQSVCLLESSLPSAASNRSPRSRAARCGRAPDIDAGGLPLADVALGDSIAINGACMTVVEKTGSAFAVDVSRESLNRTAGLDQPGEVNLEKALTLAERLGGHLVSGHVDGLGTVHSFEPDRRILEAGDRRAPELGKYLAYKGSIVVNGVSLTVNSVEDSTPRRQSLPLLDQPDPAHDRRHHAQAPARGRQGEPRNRPDRALRRAHAQRRQGLNERRRQIFPCITAVWRRLPAGRQ
jgi:riboflavin synthase alpha subunit